MVQKRYILGQVIDTNQMNFKIQQTYPSPTAGVSNFNTLTYAEHIKSLVLYGEQKPESQVGPDQPKKKIAFKVDKMAAAVSNDKISIFSINERKWEVVQAKGKIPSPRSDFQSIYMKPCVVIYGGKTNAKLVNEVYALNCQTWTWKKLFSLDGPPAAEQFLFFRISSQTAGLIICQTLWILRLIDVKWELSSNQLPGSVWEKLNLEIPEGIKFCWPLNCDQLVIAGEKEAIKVNLAKKQIVMRLDFDWVKALGKVESGQHQIRAFHLSLESENKEQSSYSIVYVVSPFSVSALKYADSLGLLPQKNLGCRVELQKPIKCCAFVRENSNPHQCVLFYIDIKGELLSISMEEETANLQLSTSRVIDSETQNVITNSCIAEEQNEDSSAFIPSANSRLKGYDQSDPKIQTEEPNSEHEAEEIDQYLVDSRVASKVDPPRSNCAAESKQAQDGLASGSRVSKKIQQPSDQSFEGRQDKTTQQVSWQNNPGQKQCSNDRFKHKTEWWGENEKKTEMREQLELQEERNNPSGTIQLKMTLENILYNESIKRKLLESKVDALEQIIKKSEKFVLVLCKYGNEPQKHRHIERVRQIRQELEANWSKQIYYRKEMEMNKMPSQISHQIQQTMNHIQYS